MLAGLIGLDILFLIVMCIVPNGITISLFAVSAVSTIALIVYSVVKHRNDKNLEKTASEPVKFVVNGKEYDSISLRDVHDNMSDYVKVCIAAIQEADERVRKNEYKNTLNSLAAFDYAFLQIRKHLSSLSEDEKRMIGDLRYTYGNVIATVVGYERNIELTAFEYTIPNYYFLFDNWPDNHTIDATHQQYRVMLDRAFRKIKDSEESKSRDILEEAKDLIIVIENYKTSFDGLELGRYAGLVFRYDADSEKY